MSQSAKLSLSTKDVIHIEGFQENASLFKNESTLRIRTILQQLQNACTASGMSLAEINAWMESGIPCEVLRPGVEDWTIGRLRLSLEFQPGAVSMSDAASSQISNATISDAVMPDAPIATSAVSEMPDLEMPDLEMPDLEMPDLEMSGSSISAPTMSSKPTISEPTISEPEMDFGADLNADLNADLMDDLDTTFGSDIDLGCDEDLSGMMPDANLEESMNSDLELSTLSEMDDLKDGLGIDDMSFDMDSQAVEAEDMGKLSDPWDLSDDLDEMLLTNSNP